MESPRPTIIGLDPATISGWATYESLGPGKPPRVECGSFKAEGDNEAAIFADFARKFRELLDRTKPRRAAIEMRLPSQAGGELVDDPRALVHGRFQRQQIRNENNIKRQDGCRAIILAQLGLRRPSIGLPNGIPYEEVAVNSWRASFFGKGFKPPRTIEPKKRRAWWKTETRLKAEMLGEKWGFRVPNTDAADAVAIVLWLAAREHQLDARDDLLRRVA